MEKTLTEILHALEDLTCKTKQSALVLCREGDIPAVQKEGRWYMDSSYIDAAVEWRKKHVTLEEIKAECAGYEGLREEEKRNCDRNIRRRIGLAISDEQINQYGLLFAGTLYPFDRAEEIRGIVETCVREHKLRQTLLPAADAAKKMGMSVYQLKQAVKAGTLVGVRVDDDLYLEPDVVDGYRQQRGVLIGAYDWLKAELPGMEIETVWDIENRTDRSLLNNMLRQSAVGTLLVSWEQAGQRGDRRNSLYFPREIQDQVQEIVVTYLKNFGFKEELYELRRNAPYWKEHPKTMEALDRFETTKIPQKMASLYEVFVEVHPPEIMECTDADIDRLVEYQVLRDYSEQNRARIAEKILKNIVSRRALTTNVSTQCLLLAAGKSCSFHRCTLGCRFGMYERGGLIYAIEFIREQYEELVQAETEGERRKIQGLLEDCYIPTVVMMLTICKEQLHMDIAEYRDALLGLMSQEGERNVVCVEERERAPRKNALDVHGFRAC